MNKTGNGIYNLQETNNYLYKRYPEFSNTNTKKIKNDGGQNIGKEVIETGMNYSWQFYIVTK